MKTKEELFAIKEEVESLGKKLQELTEDELTQVTGGTPFSIYGRPCIPYEPDIVIAGSGREIAICQHCGKPIYGTRAQIDAHIANCQNG